MGNPLTDAAEMASKENGETCPGRQADRVLAGKKASITSTTGQEKARTNQVVPPSNRRKMLRSIKIWQPPNKICKPGWIFCRARLARGFFCGLNDRVGSFVQRLNRAFRPREYISGERTCASSADDEGAVSSDVEG